MQTEEARGVAGPRILADAAVHTDTHAVSDMSELIKGMSWLTTSSKLTAGRQETREKVDQMQCVCVCVCVCVCCLLYTSDAADER